MVAVALASSVPLLVLAQQGGQAPASGTAADTQGFEVYVSEDALQALYMRNIDIGDLGRNDVRGGFFINEDRDLIGMADMMVDVGEPERRRWWSLEVGPRVYGALLTIEDQDVFSVALGGKLSYYLGRRRVTAVSVTAFYAPDILTFGNADNIKDVTFAIETELTEQTRVFVGYREFEFDLDVDREVDDGAHIGIRYSF